jgi:adenylate cyclase class 2
MKLANRELLKFSFLKGLDVYSLTMPKAAHHDEIEIKLFVRDVSSLRSRLKRLRAREITPRTYEANTLYDTLRQDLRRGGQLIRIRIQHPASGFSAGRPTESAPAILTYKGPSRLARIAKKTCTQSKTLSQFKVKDEAEVSLSRADEMARILRALDLHPVFRYEKFRTTYALPGLRGLKIELDETPVGLYLELEGPVASIDRGARLLGFGRKDYMKDTYGSLYIAACRRQGRKPGDMLFPPTKKLR